MIGLETQFSVFLAVVSHIYQVYKSLPLRAHDLFTLASDILNNKSLQAQIYFLNNLYSMCFADL